MNLLNDFVNPEILLLLGITMMLAMIVIQQNKKIHDHEKRLKLLKSDINALLVCSRGVGSKLNHQFTEFRNLIERQDRLELGEKSDPAYRQAMALLDKGVSEEEMIDACDLTHGEAELIARLRRHRPAASQRVELVA